MASPRICSVEGCGKPAGKSGWCKPHYMRWWHTGDIQATRPFRHLPRDGEPEQFLKEVALSYQGDDCLLWPYSKANYGYGEVRFGGRKGRKRLVHRVICELTRGPPPSGKNDAAHSCGNRLCCNPRHLRWASRTENVADSRLHGTISRGERNGHARVTESDVRLIRALRGKATQQEIAKRFGVSRAAVSAIQRRSSWAWLE